ncbi:MAG: hypothetical protein HFF17_14730 [Oscillospiraceae bacterium]|nr:hypothetical protein [Oscillospiraceae bacterium]
MEKPIYKGGYEQAGLYQNQQILNQVGAINLNVQQNTMTLQKYTETIEKKIQTLEKTSVAVLIVFSLLRKIMERFF